MQKVKIKNKIYQLGDIYHVRFGKTIIPEIDNVHLAIVFPIYKCNTMIFCLPLTSAKEKHFLNKLAYIKRDKNKLKYHNTYYIKETDSIALFEQFRAISVERLESIYKDPETKMKIELSKYEINSIKRNLINFLIDKVIENNK